MSPSTLDTSHKLTVPVNLLRARKADAVALLRIAAGVNAMEATLRSLLLYGDEDRSPAGHLAYLHHVVAAIGYLREIVRTIERIKYEQRFWELVNIGIGYGFTIERPIDEVRALLSPSNPEIGGSVLLKVRDKVGFHWDPEPFETFLDDAKRTEVVTWEAGGPKKLDRIFRGAADAVEAWLGGITSTDNADFVKDLVPIILDAQNAIGDVVEAAFAGLLVEAGEDPANYFTEGNLQREA